MSVVIIMETQWNEKAVSKFKYTNSIKPLTFVRRPKNETPMKREGSEQFEIYK